MKEIEQSIQNGFWVLIENVGEELDPALEPVLLRKFSVERGRGKMIVLGDKKISYHDSF